MTKVIIRQIKGSPACTVHASADSRDRANFFARKYAGFEAPYRNIVGFAFGWQGGFKSPLTYTEAEGNPILLSLCGSFLAVATDAGVIKLYDVSKRAKTDASTLPVGSSKKRTAIWKSEYSTRIKIL